MHGVRLRAAIACAVVAACAAPATASAQNGTLRAGAGKADVTPATGYYLGGWTRADRTAHGQHTRLWSRALVLERGGRKVALVAIDLFMVPGGMVKHIGERLAAQGFSEQNILISASHTHSGPGGYANYPTLNTAAPSFETTTALDVASYMSLLNPGPANPQLYRFLVERISTAIARANQDLGAAEAGWGSARIVGITRNRSLEAHLANHDIIKARGEGSEADDPGGYEHTIDPDVDVLRVDKVVRRKGKRVRVPIGGWSNFADHGTVTKSSFEFYNQDHHASAIHVFEKRVRRSGKVPAGQEVLNVYGNSNEGDMSAGLTRHGPAASDYVGRIEGSAMFRAWGRAKRQLSSTPPLDTRWTRVCFCGQETEGGAVSDHSEVGLPFLTGSEEERGPLFDLTGQHYEDTRAPSDRGPHGHKASAPGIGDVPNVVPLMAVRIGKRLLVSLPGEGTKEVGARIRAAVSEAAAGFGIERVALAGLANEFVLYFTTPEEYERQHYEGGNTQFGRFSANLMKVEIARLAGALVRGQPAPPPAEFDATNGVRPDGPEYGAGAETATLLEQPAESYQRLGHARIAWQGGPGGLDRPLDTAFVTAERRVGTAWVRYDDDLGLAMLWEVDDEGRHQAKWEIPRSAPLGEYRLVVQAKRYRLESRSFRVVRFGGLTVRQVPARHGHSAVVLEYPEARRDIDLTTRPQFADGGIVKFRVGTRIVRVAQGPDSAFTVRVPGGVPVFLEPGMARDRWGNANGDRVGLN
jgi:neutral ceramidase